MRWRNQYWLYIAAVLFAIGIVALMSSIDADGAADRAGPPLPSTVLQVPRCGEGQTRAIQAKLASYGYTIVVDDLYGPQTTRVVKHWQRANGLQQDGCAGPLTIETLDLNKTAVATVPAARAPEPVVLREPPAPVAPDDLCAEMSAYRIAAGLPDQFDAIGYRESRCQNTAANYCCYGWWQNYLSSHLSSQSAYRDRIINECGVTQVSDMLGDSESQKRASACVTYVVWSISGMSPWAL